MQYDGRSLVPDFSGALGIAMQAAQQNQAKAEQEKQHARMTAAQMQVQEKSFQDIVNDPAAMMAIERMNGIREGSGNQWMKRLAMADELEDREIKSQIDHIQKFNKTALHFARNGDIESANKLIKKEIRSADPERKQALMDLLSKSDNEKILGLQGNLIMAGGALAMQQAKYKNLQYTPDGKAYALNEATNAIEQVPNNSGLDLSKPKPTAAAMTPYQQAQLANQNRQMDLQERKFQSDQLLKERQFNQQSIKANALNSKNNDAVKKDIDRVKSSLGVVDKLIKHPGRKAATGKSAILPTRPGSKAKDYEVSFGQLEGKAFLEAVAALRGSGQISNTEGDKAQQSILGLALDQGEEEHLARLKEIRKTFAKALKTKVGTYNQLNQGSQQQEIGTVSTQEDYDSLPSGSIFIDSADGKQYRKP